MNNIQFDADLIRRYDTTGPRYTSYPSALAFQAFTPEQYQTQAHLSNEDLIPLPLSLYVHIPFCDTVCFYCACNKVVTKQYGQAETYLTYLFREIALQAKLYDRDRIVEQLHWGGGTPTFLNHDQIRALMAELRSHFTLDNSDSRDFSIEIDPRSVSSETIALLKEVGFNRFSLGVQDIDESVQRAVNRIQPIGKTMEIIQACRAQQAKSISIDLIYGLPLQTVERFMRTLDTVIALAPDRLSLFNYAHLPHLFKPQRRINVEDLPSSDEKLQILQRSVERLSAAGYVYIGMDHFAKPDNELTIAQQQGSLYRNFQGYSTHAECDLIGLGITSIGMVNDTYSQNLKTLEAYGEHIEQGRLAVYRGVALTTDDKIRRAVITQLICHFELDFAQIEQQYQIIFKDYFGYELNTLQAMVNDGLITLTEQKITVLARGRLLIRNVCMAFDWHLRQSQQKKFSKVI